MPKIRGNQQVAPICLCKRNYVLLLQPIFREQSDHSESNAFHSLCSCVCAKWNVRPDLVLKNGSNVLAITLVLVAKRGEDQQIGFHGKFKRHYIIT